MTVPQDDAKKSLSWLACAVPSRFVTTAGPYGKSKCYRGAQDSNRYSRCIHTKKLVGWLVGWLVSWFFFW